MKYRSELARSIAHRNDKKGVRGWSTYLGLVGIVFIVLTLTASASAAPSIVVHLGSSTSVAKYMGYYDYRPNVLMLGVANPDDWVCIKMQFNGKLSQLSAITFSEFIIADGGEDPIEPYVVVTLSGGTSLICRPELSYDSGWYQPMSEWQMRDTVSHGKWTAFPYQADAQPTTLGGWADVLGDRQVTHIFLYVGAWDLADPFMCLIGEFAVNDKLLDLANAKRCGDPNSDLPTGY